MSDILIHGIEMPKNCEKCLYLSWSNFYQIYVCNAVRKNEPVLFDGKQTKITSCVRSARADNCPLVSVQPHGRLIDADALTKQVKRDGIASDPFVRIVCNYFKDAPTIIPASMEGET